MNVEAQPQQGQTETVTLVLSEEWRQRLAALTEGIRAKVNVLELTIIGQLRQNGQSPFQETSPPDDPRLKEPLELLAFCEIGDALKRGMRALISPRREADEKYPGPHVIIRTYVSTTRVGWELAHSTLAGLGEYGRQIIEALESGQFVILKPPVAGN